MFPRSPRRANTEPCACAGWIPLKPQGGPRRVTGLPRSGNRTEFAGARDLAGAPQLAGGRQREDHLRRFPGPAGSAGKGLGTPGSPRTSSGSAWRRAPGAESRCRRCRPLAGLPETPSCRTKAPNVYPLAHPPSQAPSDPLFLLPRPGFHYTACSSGRTSGLSIPGGLTLWFLLRACVLGLFFDAPCISQSRTINLVPRNSSPACPETPSCRTKPQAGNGEQPSP